MTASSFSGSLLALGTPYFHRHFGRCLPWALDHLLPAVLRMPSSTVLKVTRIQSRLSTFNSEAGNGGLRFLFSNNFAGYLVEVTKGSRCVLIVTNTAARCNDFASHPPRFVPIGRQGDYNGRGNSCFVDNKYSLGVLLMSRHHTAYTNVKNSVTGSTMTDPKGAVQSSGIHQNTDRDSGYLLQHVGFGE